ncbi:MAG: ATP-binding protein [Moraxella sp.]|nr:ATP-binding protein [Moraxella sp.]
MIDDELIALAKAVLKAHLPTAITLDPDVWVYRWANDGLQVVDVNLSISLDDLQGIDTQKHKLIQNTRQFLHGFPANHVLMTGARGVGKSSLVRALLHAFGEQGLRIIEVSRDDLRHLDKIRSTLKTLPETSHHRYIVYCDDLAFNAQDENYRTLKSILDGALDSGGDNLLIYATSNRRHLLPQLMKDNVSIYNGQTDEVNPYETIDETVSLSDRFGLWLSFYATNQETYLQIVRHYLAKSGIAWNDELAAEALQWASTRGGRSGRVAYQFSRHWLGQYLLEQHLS